MNKIVFSLSAGAVAVAAHAQVRITEWAYQGNSGEYIEITNTGPNPISLDTYSFDDSSRVPGSMMLSGTLAPGASAIICDILAAEFRANWNIPEGVLIIGGNTNNLGRADEINIFDGLNLIDRLTYDDQSLGGPRTQNVSGVTQPANWGANTVAAWFRSAVGDSYGSYTSAQGDIGNPGIVPAPGAAAVLGMGLVAVGRRRR